MITLNNMIYANPQAYQVFPEMVNSANTGTTERAEYSGYLDIVQDGLVVKLFTGTNSIDLSEFKSLRIRIDNVTDRGSVVLGEWDFGKDTGEAIRDAMVLWYDLKRQGATNESMAADPTLRDLSGNGHDATCYNFAWSGMSGIGGYAIDFNNWFSQSNTAWKITNKTYKTLIFKCISASITELTYILQNKFEKKNFSIQITSNNPELKFELISLFNNSTSNRVIQQNEDGVIQTDYTDEEFNTIGGVYPTLRITADTFSFLKKDDIITIEQLPLYPHALVSDGVDDYCLAEGLPLLTREKGYTVVAKRKWLDINNDSINNTFLSKNTDTVGIRIESRIASNGDYYTYSFGSSSIIQKETSDFIYQTTNSYCGTEINSGNTLDEPIVTLFDNKSDGGWYSSIALYSLLLFNRDLTPEEIAWVKQNLMS